VQGTELTKQLNQGTLTERVVDAGVEGKGGELLGKDLDPSHGGPDRHEIALVEYEHDVLVGVVLADVLFDVPRARPHRITGIQHLDDHIR
jgi:hypothetical protein